LSKILPSLSNITQKGIPVASPLSES
jgi:hypothetical protein